MIRSLFKMLFPKETPLSLLIEHAEILEVMLQKNRILIEKYLNNEDIEDLVVEISKLESKADDLKCEIREMLSKNIKTPFAIKDMLDYLNYQEKLIDYFEDIAKKLSLNRIEGLDDEAKSLFLELLSEVELSVKSFIDMIKEVKKMVDYSFTDKLIQIEEEEQKKVESVEGKVDRISLKLGKWIYSKKKELNPMDLIFFRELILLLVRITDVAENTSELINVFIKRSKS